MSNTKKQKIVRIAESNLVDLIDEIVKEAVAVEKKKWIAEHAKKGNSTLVENRIAKLEAKIEALTKAKK